jgi:L-alanine-DL-glutamate epimerase-like enolase superfamily enzyme
VRKRAARVERIKAEAFAIPTDAPESDGTLEWESTTIVVVHASGGGATGLGYTYADAAAVPLIETVLARVVTGRPATDVESGYVAMRQAVRNIGGSGLAAAAVSAVDIALWDLKAQLLDISLVSLLGSVRDRVPVYGSGGFTSYSIERLQKQLAMWTADGIGAVKMKVGRHPAEDPDRVEAAREAIGPAPALFVDANGAYDRKQALAMAAHFAASDVTWFEEPVSSDDLPALRLLVERAPASMDIAAGEYACGPIDFRRLAEARAVDVLQADATRCGGVSGFLRAGAIGDAWGLPMSAHTAPSVHAHLCCAVARIRHLEYFHDHVRIEQMLFDGVLQPADGLLEPDRARAGLGITFRRSAAARYAA